MIRKKLGSMLDPEKKMKPEVDSGELRRYNLVPSHFDRSVSSGFFDDHHASNYKHISDNMRRNGRGRGPNANLNTHNSIPRFGNWDLDHRFGNTHVFNNTRHDGEPCANAQRNDVVTRRSYWNFDHWFGNSHFFNNTSHAGPRGEPCASIHRSDIVRRFGYWNLDHRFGNTHIFCNGSRRSVEQNGTTLDPCKNPYFENTRLRRKGAREETKTPATKYRKFPRENRNPTKVSLFSWIKRGWSRIKRGWSHIF